MNVKDDGGNLALASLLKAPIQAKRVVRTEEFEGQDVAILLCDMPAIPLLGWERSPVQLLTDVSAFGFPYAASQDESGLQYSVTIRGFKGHIITRRKIWRYAAKPVGYEVSCAFPPGLSGAPLLRASVPVPDLVLVGIVVAHASVEVEGKEFQFGEALDVLELGSLKSELLGGTLESFRTKVREDLSKSDAKIAGPSVRTATAVRQRRRRPK